MNRVVLVCQEDGTLDVYVDADRAVAVELRNQSMFGAPIGSKLVPHNVLTQLGRVLRWPSGRYQLHVGPATTEPEREGP